MRIQISYIYDFVKQDEHTQLTAATLERETKFTTKMHFFGVGLSGACICLLVYSIATVYRVCLSVFVYVIVVKFNCFDMNVAYYFTKKKKNHEILIN